MNIVELDPITLLERAWKRIENPAAWCQGSMATDQDGKPVTANNPTACRWCAVGALLAECGSASMFDLRLPAAYHQARDVLDGAAAKVTDHKAGTGLTANERANSHSDIETMFRMAIAAAKSRWGQGELG